MNTLFQKLLSIISYLCSDRVEFNDGSYIEFCDREEILYVENSGRQMEIVWYFQTKTLGKGRVLFLTAIDCWNAPYEKEFIPIQKKEEIKEKIVEYCRKRRIPLIIKDSEESDQQFDDVLR